MLSHDFRHSFRLLLRHRRTSLATVLMLGLGIGANVALFTIVNAAFLRPLPFQEPERLVFLYGSFPGLSREDLANFSYPDFLDVRRDARSFEAIAAQTDFTAAAVEGRDGPARVQPNFVDGPYFEILGTVPSRGRGFTESDLTGGAPVAVLSHALWHRLFGGDPAIVGRSIRVNGIGFEVVGVMPEGFVDLAEREGRLVDMWMPLRTAPRVMSSFVPDNRAGRLIWGVARLRPGVTAGDAEQELQTISAELERIYPDTNRGFGVHASPLRSIFFREMRQPLTLLAMGAGFVLVIVCCNVAVLLVARGTARQRELAVRLALGASRGRIVRQFLVESMLLSSVAAAIGAVFAVWALPGLLLLAQNNLAFANDIRISLPVLAATAFLALGAGVVMGLYPAVQGSRSDIVSVLRDGGRTIAGALGSHRTRRAIVTAQVAVSLVLLIGAALLVTSFEKLRSQRTGFDSANIFVAGISLPPSRYPDIDSQGRFWLRLGEALSNAAGATRATLVSTPPLNGGGFTRSPYALAEGAVPPLNERPLGLTISVTPGYFATMRIPLVAGRDFTERDTASAHRVAIVSRSTARKLGGEDAVLGRRIIMGANGEVMEVIGITEDTRTQALASIAEVEFYRPVMQRQRPFMQMMVKTAGDPAAFETTARQVLSNRDATLPMTAVTTHDAIVAQSLAQQRLLFVLLGVFALLAVVLSSVGIYGVVASFVGQRTPEIGVRMALGASRLQVIGIVLGQSIAPVGTGLLLGLVGAVGLGRFVEGLLFEVSPLDPLMLASAVVSLALVAGAACAIPAGRAARIDPVSALRGE